jgi:hypothetical protein
VTEKVHVDDLLNQFVDLEELLENDQLMDALIKTYEKLDTGKETAVKETGKKNTLVA